jgi:hypothetical protein
MHPLAKGLKARASPVRRTPDRSGPSFFASWSIEGVSMLVESHQYGGGTWAFYVIAPVILCGVVACLWWIVRGAIADIRPRRRR